MRIPDTPCFTDIITPLGKVLLMFATAPFNTGTVIHAAFNPGLLVDRTGAKKREIHYNLKMG